MPAAPPAPGDWQAWPGCGGTGRLKADDWRGWDDAGEWEGPIAAILAGAERLSGRRHQAKCQTAKMIATHIAAPMDTPIMMPRAGAISSTDSAFGFAFACSLAGSMGRD